MRNRRITLITICACAAGAVLLLAPGAVAQIRFPTQSAELDATARHELDQVARWLAQNGLRKVVIAGQTETQGSQFYDAELGGARALAAKNYLMSRGVREDRILVLSLDQRLPAPANQGPLEQRVVYLLEEPPENSTWLGADFDLGDQPIAVPEPPIPRAPAAGHEGVHGYLPPTPPGFDDGESGQGRHAGGTRDLWANAGMSLSVGGGVADFLDNDTRQFTNIGGVWEARVAYGTRVPIGFEAGYVGSAFGMKALGLDSSATLLGTGLEAAVRVNAPFDFHRVQPYAFGGVGFTHYDVVNEAFNLSSLAGSESAWGVPLGAGLGFHVGGLLFDLRATFRPTFSDDLVRDELGGNQDDARLHTWATTARVGWEF